jgi:hypothetical protein
MSAESAHRWRTNNPERAAAYGRAWREAHPEYVEVSRRWRKEDPARHAAYERAWRLANPESATAIQRRSHIYRKYDMTGEELENLIESQGGLCAICGRPETRAVRGVVSSLAIDHDHATKVNRGLLCFNCNAGIGLFGDDPAILTAAAVYLDRHRARGES